MRGGKTAWLLRRCLSISLVVVPARSTSPNMDKSHRNFAFIICTFRFENRCITFVAGAGAPTTGARVFREWPSLKAATSQRFVEALAPALPDSLNRLRLDKSRAHTAQRMRGPAQVRSIWLPPCGPERNPIERVWRDLKDDLAWQPCADREVQQN
ncbi:MAG TPA: transposase [Gammaproteobacteria bacterium]|nr:transposase [Gammaproteobacteria bacterium]